MLIKYSTSTKGRPREEQQWDIIPPWHTHTRLKVGAKNTNDQSIAIDQKGSHRRHTALVGKRNEILHNINHYNGDFYCTFTNALDERYTSQFNMKIKEFIIMPHTADVMGLIHKPGKGPNNRFDFKNKGNNKANEIEKEEAAGVGIITKQNTTKDVKPGDEYKNVKKLQLAWKEFKENFADGKRKGKSRPGRVKRAGASCKGSVSSLRSKAKKYGGEKGKMYHWCANMKSGRKK